MLVVVDQIGDGVATVFFGQVELPSGVLLDVVVFDVGVRSGNYTKNEM
jgi:hypothetical protein